MTDWRTVQGSQSVRPEEFDTSTSKVTVYQRKNIERITVDNEGVQTELWQYDERQMTYAEYFDLCVRRNAANTDYMSMMTGVELPNE